MPGGLAQFGVGGGDVEEIVDDLERHAEAVAEGGERVDVVAGQFGHDAADAAGRAQQRGGLAIDRGEVGLFGALQIEGVLQFEDLALAQLPDGGGEQSGHLGPERSGDLGGLGQQIVAGEDGGEVAPASVDARDGAARGGVVHHVVVVEGTEVHEFDRHRAHDDVERSWRHDRGGRGGGGDGERRSHALAAGEDQVAGHLGEEGVVGHDRGRERVLDPDQVGLEHRQLEEGGCRRHLRNDRGRAPNSRNRGM